MSYLREIGCALCATVGFSILDGLVVIVGGLPHKLTHTAIGY